LKALLRAEFYNRKSQRDENKYQKEITHRYQLK